jgi:hypothetical protein
MQTEHHTLTIEVETKDQAKHYFYLIIGEDTNRELKNIDLNFISINRI